MRAFLISLIATITTATSASAVDMRGLWLDNKDWDGVQAVVQMYDCEDGVGLCARIVRAYKGELVAGQQNYLLIRNLQPQRNGSFKGIINPPVSFVGDSTVDIKLIDERNLSYSSCFLPFCKGTMTKL
ncbi:DUF2147 domain-containing protein [Alphaproteobacteria bacterium]|jgi:hypothetical protein|nr:DUF2147 domain-containing protein [Alphaproteobacteria bacterium]